MMKKLLSAIIMIIIPFTLYAAQADFITFSLGFEKGLSPSIDFVSQDGDTDPVSGIIFPLISRADVQKGSAVTASIWAYYKISMIGNPRPDYTLDLILTDKSYGTDQASDAFMMWNDDDHTSGLNFDVSISGAVNSIAPSERDVPLPASSRIFHLLDTSTLSSTYTVGWIPLEFSLSPAVNEKGEYYYMEGTYSGYVLLRLRAK